MLAVNLHGERVGLLAGRGYSNGNRSHLMRGGVYQRRRHHHHHRRRRRPPFIRIKCAPWDRQCLSD